MEHLETMNLLVECGKERNAALKAHTETLAAHGKLLKESIQLQEDYGRALKELAAYRIFVVCFAIGFIAALIF